jgi:glycerol transport system ATP-binding protein
VFQPGQLTTLLGRTGAGKTTLMRVIAGLTIVDQGSLALNLQNWGRLAPWKRPVAMVTQQFINYPHLSALDNVAFPLVRRGERREAARAAARRELDRVGLGHLTDRRPGQLSGGQQQRVAIARALIKQAPVLLLDEPFVNLDYKLREGLREELVDLLKAETGTIVIYATTEPREALQLGDRVVLMAKGQIVQDGAPRAVFAAPRSLQAADVINDPPINLLPLTVRGNATTLGLLGAADLGAMAAGLPDGGYTLGLRAQDVVPGGHVQARVTLTEVSGSETVTHLAIGDQPLVMQQRSVVAHALGQTLDLTLNTAQGLIYGPDGRLLRNGADHG